MNYKRILIIRFGGAGDILMTTPTLRALAAAYPGAEIDYVVGAEMTAAIEGHPNVTRVLPFDKRGALSVEDYARFLSDLCWPGYDLVLNFHPNIKSCLMTAAARPKRAVFFRKTMQRGGVVVHAIDDFAKELRKIGLDGVDDWRLDFVVPQEAVDATAAILADAGVGPDDPLLVINPAASRPVNRWPQERFADVAAHFARSGAKVAVTGAGRGLRSIIDGLDEESLAETIAAADPRIVNLAGRISLKQYGALLQRASAFLTCDTGPMHIGAAIGAPMVVLSGAADPDRTGPVTEASSVLIDYSLPCVPCRARTCRIGGVQCMDRLAVDRVVDAVEIALSQSRRSTVGVPLPVVPAQDRPGRRTKDKHRRPAVGW